MYTALGLMFLGIFVGFAMRRLVALLPFQAVIFTAVLFLLFLLGAQIGANQRLFADLGHLGLQALVLAVFCMAGSILVVWLLPKLLASIHRGRNNQ